VDGVELEKATEFGADLLLDVTVPPVGGQAIGAIGLPIKGNVIRTFEFDDVIAANGVGAVTTGRRVDGDRKSQFSAGTTERCDIFDLCGDGRR
jgi:hypothetical protein